MSRLTLRPKMVIIFRPDQCFKCVRFREDREMMESNSSSPYEYSVVDWTSGIKADYHWYRVQYWVDAKQPFDSSNARL